MVVILESRISSSGQVRLPKPVLKELGVEPGDAVEFVIERGVVRVRSASFRAALDKWSGYLGDLGGQSVDEIIEEMRGR